MDHSKIHVYATDLLSRKYFNCYYSAELDTFP